jgi:uncharacterized protein YecT (DUF1311 family)
MWEITSAAFLLALVGASPAVGQTRTQIQARYSADYGRCMKSGDAANGVTAAIMDCNGNEIDRQDARLNQAYKMVMTRLTAPQKTTLRVSERTWITQRDALCHRASSAESGGSLEGIIYSGCILDETIKRLVWLEAYRG